LVLGIELKHQPALSRKLEVIPSGGPHKPEEIETWQIRAEAELTRLRSLTAAQFGAEVMRRGFADLSGDGGRTRIGLSNSLCPDAPPVVGGDDINVVEQYSGLLAPVLSALEDAGLLSSEPRGRSALRFYSLTTRGRSALGDDGVETILAARS
jgi:DNA-binding transcriptional ArsR family regulator